MEKNEIREFSVPALLLVTGFCFLSFAMIFKILDGVSMKFFMRAGFTTLIAGAITAVFIFIDAKKEQRSIS